MAVTPTLSKRGVPLADPKVQLAQLDAIKLPQRFEAYLNDAGLFPLMATGISFLQVNLGKRCNQTCSHCHVDAGPDRKEVMPREVMDLCLAALAKSDIPTLDITGGAPELHPDFRYLVEEARKLGRHVM